MSENADQIPPQTPLVLSAAMPNHAIAAEFHQDRLGRRDNAVRALANQMLAADPDFAPPTSDELRQPAKQQMLQVVTRFTGVKFGDDRPRRLTQGMLDAYVAGTMSLLPAASSVPDFPFDERGALWLLRARGLSNADIYRVAGLDKPALVYRYQTGALTMLKEHFGTLRRKRILDAFLTLGGVELLEPAAEPPAASRPAGARGSGGAVMSRNHRLFDFPESDRQAADSFRQLIGDIKPQLSPDPVMDKALFDHMVRHFSGISYPGLRYNIANASYGLSVLGEDIRPEIVGWNVTSRVMSRGQANLLGQLFGMGSRGEAVRPKSFVTILKERQADDRHASAEDLRQEIHLSLERFAKPQRSI